MTLPRSVEDLTLLLVPGRPRRFGTFFDAIRVTLDAAPRSPSNWLLPGLGTICACLLVMVGKYLVAPSHAFSGMLFRVFVVDYAFFVFGLLSGWNMAATWRRSADAVEEISLCGMPGACMGLLLNAGSLAVWVRTILLFMFVDLAAPEPAPILLKPIGVLLFGWFHFESVRLAHWMFTVHSLPRISLVQAAIGNFILMTFLVCFLSAVGSAITGLVMAAMASTSLAVASHAHVADSYGGWYTAALAGLLLVALLKRFLATTWEGEFAGLWLLYQWAGAGERLQPRPYPEHFYRAMRAWRAWEGAMEDENLGTPEPLRRWGPPREPPPTPSP